MASDWHLLDQCLDQIRSSKHRRNYTLSLPSGRRSKAPAVIEREKQQLLKALPNLKVRNVPKVPVFLLPVIYALPRSSPFNRKVRPTQLPTYLETLRTCQLPKICHFTPSAVKIGRASRDVDFENTLSKLFSRFEVESSLTCSRDGRSEKNGADYKPALLNFS